ncbi:flavin monoamine oxidase family protein [Mesorhizobium sp. AA22]|uniref:flavin monoamine oxidase family protein n=1 Tax=Mesorhizobium sp. AA22 TaxID=1854057 RepID=UPI0007EC603C|nr:flavin monoamine oxidase family protein [Mesorhizobium sp. AA22]QIA21550.1 flavin monoamine oxidase family protein [Mesorhizobium sp. AA22]
MKRQAVRTDVAIVGAGFTGLSAAHELNKAGIDFVLLEARGRVGGRVESKWNGLGERIDSGGQFLCEDMSELMALVRTLGKTLVETYAKGEVIAQPLTGEQDAERIYYASRAIRDRMNAIAPGEPTIAGLTVAAWLDRQNDPGEAKAAFRSMIEGLWCQALEKLPLWHLIDNDRRITNEVSELQYFVHETMQSLADDLAEDLGDRLRLNTPVRTIERRLGGVRLAATTGLITARTALIAMPPMVASKLDFAPPLPVALEKALGVWQSGAVIKMQVRYPTAFWRAKGLSGMVMWRDPPALFACDVSKDGGHPALVVFVGGPLALRWRELGDAALRAEVTARLKEALGTDAGSFTDFSCRDWTDDRWSGGGYSDLIIDASATDAEQTLLAGAPPVYFASSELSPSFPGYVEGAIVAGRIAAQKILSEFNPQ